MKVSVYPVCVLEGGGGGLDNLIMPSAVAKMTT